MSEADVSALLEPGTVWLAGAGPGDPGLLTLHALSGLRQADVIVYDALVDARILKLANLQARLDYAGKRGGKPSADQDDISSHLIALAQKGLRVLRLKGGDPMIFGRGGEEAQALAAAGVPFRIIPGISAGIGGLAYAGIPATHRLTNHAVTFVTGHIADDEAPDLLDWSAIAKGAPVIVIYMGLKHLTLIAEKLVAAGRKPEEPAAFVSHASQPGQTVIETTIGAMAETARREKPETPMMVVIGPVVALRKDLDWFKP